MGRLKIYNGTSWIYLDSSAATSSSYALTASYALNGGGSSLSTGSLYPITSSWSINSISSSFSSTASYFNQLWLETGSNYPITSSWSISASWAPNNSSIVDGGSYNISSSWSSGSISSSYALTASYALNGSSAGPIPIQVSFDGQGFVVTSGSISYKPISTTGTYTKFVTICDLTGSIIYKVDKFTPTTNSFGSPTSLGDITLTDQLYTSSVVSWSVTDADVVTISLSGSITNITKTSIIIS